MRVNRPPRPSIVNAAESTKHNGSIVRLLLSKERIKGRLKQRLTADTRVRPLEYFREDAINETGPGDEHYIDSEFGPLLADEDQYGYHMQVRSTNAKTKFMSLNKNQLLGIIDAIKRG